MQLSFQNVQKIRITIFRVNSGKNNRLIVYVNLRFLRTEFIYTQRSIHVYLEKYSCILREVFMYTQRKHHIFFTITDTCFLTAKNFTLLLKSKIDFTFSSTNFSTFRQQEPQARSFKCTETDASRLKRRLRGHCDILYIIDSSSSISRAEFRKGIKAIQMLIDESARDSLHAAI